MCFSKKLELTSLSLIQISQIQMLCACFVCLTLIAVALEYKSQHISEVTFNPEHTVLMKFSLANASIKLTIL